MTDPLRPERDLVDDEASNDVLHDDTNEAFDDHADNDGEDVIGMMRKLPGQGHVPQEPQNTGGGGGAVKPFVDWSVFGLYKDLKGTDWPNPPFSDLF